MVRTLFSLLRPGFDPLIRELRSHKPQGPPNKQKIILQTLCESKVYMFFSKISLQTLQFYSEILKFEIVLENED